MFFSIFFSDLRHANGILWMICLIIDYGKLFPKSLRHLYHCDIFQFIVVVDAISVCIMDHPCGLLSPCGGIVVPTPWHVWAWPTTSTQRHHPCCKINIGEKDRGSHQNGGRWLSHQVLRFEGSGCQSRMNHIFCGLQMNLAGCFWKSVQLSPKPRGSRGPCPLAAPLAPLGKLCQTVRRGARAARPCL